MFDGKSDEGQSVFAELWNKLTPTQRRFVVAMQEYPTKKEAAEAIGISPQTAYNWNGTVDDAVAFVVNDVALAMLGIIRANAVKAAAVKAAGLDSTDERVAQAASTEIMDRVAGKATQRQEVTGADGGPVQYEDVTKLSDDELQRIIES